MRATILYSFSFFVILVLSRQMSPDISSLNITEWGLPLAIALGGVFLLRRYLQAVYVEIASLSKRGRRQFIMEWALFMTAGILVGAYGSLIFHFDILSSLSVLLAFTVVGFFVSADLALQRERLLGEEAIRDNSVCFDEQRCFSLTRQLVFMTIACAILLAAILYCIFIQDIQWILAEGPLHIEQIRSDIFIEIGFTIALLLVFLVTIVISYSHNLKIFLGYQDTVLHAVGEGNLTARVPVARCDDFGRMAIKTNKMVESLQVRTAELHRTQDITIITLAALAESRDSETSGHILRTQYYVKAIAEHLRCSSRYADFLNEKTIEQLYKSSPLHDIGKVGVSDRILLKPGRLTFEEFEEIKQHTSYGRDAIARTEKYIQGNSLLRFAKEIAYTHHERFDGTGYPQGLKGDEIPLSGRIMALADVFDALISRRVYKPAFPFIEAKKIIVEGRGEQFDPDIVDAFLALQDRFRQIAFEFADSDYDRNLLLDDEMKSSCG
ncbi:HD domain-containing phosphohydrolase [Desulfovibrio inopinatus]|uniref:HD domain-containing phosphohydrolase n=1 Tax=Desulfovibrio inopinatus TaxID=102109 RepID=UPI00042A8BD8|nr:HD domain-containing phosphohydrolase [Desulfovibrio inopinatus]